MSVAGLVGADGIGESDEREGWFVMSWSWSHTDEAYAYARDRVGEMDRATLVEILAEWQAADESAPDGFNQDAFERELRRLKSGSLPTQGVLADAVWELMSGEDGRTCDNGGYAAWACPFGCGPHTVRFGPDED